MLARSRHPVPSLLRAPKSVTGVSAQALTIGEGACEPSARPGVRGSRVDWGLCPAQPHESPTRAAITDPSRNSPICSRDVTRLTAVGRYAPKSQQTRPWACRSLRDPVSLPMSYTPRFATSRHSPTGDGFSPPRSRGGRPCLRTQRADVVTPPARGRGGGGAGAPPHPRSWCLKTRCYRTTSALPQNAVTHGPPPGEGCGEYRRASRGRPASAGWSGPG